MFRSPQWHPTFEWAQRVLLILRSLTSGSLTSACLFQFQSTATYWSSLSAIGCHLSRSHIHLQHASTTGVRELEGVRTIFRGPRVAPDGGSVELLLEKHQLVLLADPPLLAEQ